MKCFSIVNQDGSVVIGSSGVGPPVAMSADAKTIVGSGFGPRGAARLYRAVHGSANDAPGRLDSSSRFVAPAAPESFREVGRDISRPDGRSAIRNRGPADHGIAAFSDRRPIG